MRGALDYLLHGITTAFNSANRRGPISSTGIVLAESLPDERFVYGYNVPDVAYEKAREQFIEFKTMTDAHPGQSAISEARIGEDRTLGPRRSAMTCSPPK